MTVAVAAVTAVTIAASIFVVTTISETASAVSIALCPTVDAVSEASSVVAVTVVSSVVVGAATVVTTIEAMAHATILNIAGVSPVASVVPAASTIHSPAVATTIDGIEVGRAEIEVGAMGVACIDAEVPVACVPIERTVEVGGFNESTILPVEQDIAEVEVTTFPIDAVKVGLRVDIHQIVEVDLVGSLVLFLGQVELIRHLVGKEESLLASLFVTHGVGLDCESEQCCEGDD